jgi:hypothetical protein
MKRSQQQNARAPSPTPTAFSGISNYRSESYRPIKPKEKSFSNTPTVSFVDAHTIARTHLDKFSRYLAVYFARGVSLLHCCYEGLLTENSAGQLAIDYTMETDTAHEAAVSGAIYGCLRRAGPQKELE